MIPAQRKPQHDEPDAPPARTAYSATVAQPGDSHAGDRFRTHRATVNAQPDQIKTRTGGER
jgi:hypothetical protein